MTFLGLDKVEWTQIISALGTFMAAIAAWKSASASKETSNTAKNQLDEMKKQREDQYIPALFANGYEYSFYFDRELGFANFSKQNLDLLYLKLSNVSSTPATSINIKWDFNLNYYINYIRDESNDEFIKSYGEGHLHTKNGHTFLDTDLSHPNAILVLKESQTIDIHLPISYRDILSICIHLFVLAHYGLSSRFDIDKMLPIITLTIGYKSINGVKKSKSFNIKPQLLSRTMRNNFGEIDYNMQVRLLVSELAK